MVTTATIDLLAELRDVEVQPQLVSDASSKLLPAVPTQLYRSGRWEKFMENLGTFFFTLAINDSCTRSIRELNTAYFLCAHTSMHEICEIYCGWCNCTENLHHRYTVGGNFHPSG